MVTRQLQAYEVDAKRDHRPRILTTRPVVQEAVLRAQELLSPTSKSLYRSEPKQEEALSDQPRIMVFSRLNPLGMRSRERD